MITVIVCILWGTLPQVQDLITSLIALNAIWLAQTAVTGARVKQSNSRRPNMPRLRLFLPGPPMHHQRTT
ncbi:hypothetical protein [Streptomyces sp. NPDC085466]|uniref:hypothetical protein n=1 Tax=Streptomyces sp. NPDC085466 TaxID=3365725 RepID=UPI0037CF0064